jgi:uncharacterized repeat protein (TIGR01451 family)
MPNRSTRGRYAHVERALQQQRRQYHFIDQRARVPDRCQGVDGRRTGCARADHVRRNSDRRRQRLRRRPRRGTFGGSVAIDDGSGVSCSFTLPQTSCSITPTSAGTKTLTATFTPDAASQANFEASSAVGSLVVNLTPAHLTLAVADAHTYARYGQVVDYMITLKNDGQTAATAVPVDVTLSSAFDSDYAHWRCYGAGSGANCTASGNGVLHDVAALPADRSLTWLVSIPVRADAAEPEATFTMSVGGMQPGNVSYSSILVLLRDGFDAPYGAAQPVATIDGAPARAILDGDALHELAVPALAIGNAPTSDTTTLLLVRDGARELRAGTPRRRQDVGAPAHARCEWTRARQRLERSRDRRDARARQRHRAR